MMDNFKRNFSAKLIVQEVIIIVFAFFIPAVFAISEANAQTALKCRARRGFAINFKKEKIV